MIRRPLLAGAIRLRGIVLQSQVTSHKSQVFFRSKVTGILIKSVSYRSPVSHLVFTGLQVSKLQVCYLQVSQLQVCYCTPWTGNLPPTWRVPSAWGGSGETLKFIEISMPVQQPHKSPNWCPKALQSDQNKLQTGARNHQNQENVKKVKSNENQCIYNVFERLGQQKSMIFPIKSHQKSCLQSKHDL